MDGQDSGQDEIVDSGTCGADGDNLTWTLDSDGVLTISGTGDMADDYYGYYSNSDEKQDRRITSVVIEKGVTSIGANAFNDCYYLADVTIPDGVTSIGAHAFGGSYNLSNVTFPDSLTDIGESAFSGCVSLNNVTLPNSLTDIADDVFYWCENLTDITIPDGVTSIGAKAFYYCIKLTDVTIPASVTSIGRYAFSCCEKLTTLTILDGVKSIEYNAFCENPSLTTVTIPASVTDIGESAFWYCHNLTDVYYDGSKADWGKIEIGDNNGPLTSGQATIHYSSDGSNTGGNSGGSSGGSTGGSSGGSTPSTPSTPGAPTAPTTPADTTGDPAELEAAFTDVPADAYYAGAVEWAVANEITNGTGGSRFSPNDDCTRTQIVTFLWRAMDTPEPESTENPFADVDVSQYYGKAVLWAVEKGITTGTNAEGTRFSPGSPCTRAQVVTFLWRAAGEPEPESMENPFADVDVSQYYGKAVLWAVENGITTGTGDGTFSPEEVCTRGQIVTFLYRSMA